MANVTKRTKQDGSISYLIRVYSGRNKSGKQIVKSMTYTPPAGMRPTTADKEVQKQAALFEDKVTQGLVSFAGSTKFEDYANAWVKNEPLAPKTRERYEDFLRRINKAIGHIRLDKLQSRHLEEFYRNLAEPGVSEWGKHATSTKLDGILKERKLSREKAAKLAKVAPSTVSIAARCKHISIEKAHAICNALELDLIDVFEVTQGLEVLSDKTILHHHRLVSTILEKAKRERLIPFNVAREHATAPKATKKEAKYLNDDEARSFLAALLNEEDIRAKTALVLALFTGARRGELCGLSWPDIDMESNIIHVRRASQYQRGRGVVEVPTKNTSSVRDIDVPRSVIDILKQYRVWWIERRLMFGEDWQGSAERLFIQDNGKPINPDTINFWLEKFLEKNHLQRITVHSLRHTFATLQITAGVDIRTLQARTGHAQASTLVNTYSHAIKSAQEAASNALESVLLPSHKTS